MKRIIVLFILLLSYSSPSYSAWSDSVKENWDKSKQYGQDTWNEYGQDTWNKTKQAWVATEELVLGTESEDERRKKYSDMEDERFREIWGAVFSKLEDGLVVVDEIEKAPDSAFFGDDKKSLKKELGKILEKTIVLLEDKSINEYREEIDDYNNKISISKNNILKYREDKITAPRSHAIKTTKEAYDTKITEENNNIVEYGHAIKQIKVHFHERLRDIGIELSQEQTDILLSRIDADDIIQMSVVFDVLKKITTQLMLLTERSGEEIKQAKKYYGMHVVLLELVNYMQQKYINMVDTVYLPKINQIIDKTVKINKESIKQISRETNQQRIIIYKKNVIAQELTLKTAKLYIKNLKNQQSKVLSAQKIVRKDLALAQNTYNTVEVSAHLLSILRISQDSFDALISLQIPEIVPFENLKMQIKYQELSDLIKDS